MPIKIATRRDVTDRMLRTIKRDLERRYPGKYTSVEEIAACDAGLIEACGLDTRVRVRNIKTDYERTGLVGRTLGWGPALLLRRRRNDRGSSDVLGPDDRIIAVQRGRFYVPASSVYE